MVLNDYQPGTVYFRHMDLGKTLTSEEETVLKERFDYLDGRVKIVFDEIDVSLGLDGKTTSISPRRECKHFDYYTSDSEVKLSNIDFRNLHNGKWDISFVLDEIKYNLRNQPLNQPK